MPLTKSVSVLRGPTRFLSMRFYFSNGQGSYASLGGIGNGGEYYFIPSKLPSLKAPKESLGKDITIPILPKNTVLCPLSEEYVGIYEMRYRKLINDVGEGGLVGHVYCSQDKAKLALVGTLAQIKRIDRLEDGGMYVLMEGFGRFYIKKMNNDKGYLCGNVQVFFDHTKYIQEGELDELERKLFNEVRYSTKLMKTLYPKNNYTINDDLLKYMPAYRDEDARQVRGPGVESELTRRTKFTFANMDMLKTDAATKLVFLQECLLEKRLQKMIKVLGQSRDYLEGEVMKRGLVTPTEMEDFRIQAMADMSDVEQLLEKKNSLSPENFIDGEWRMKSILID